MTSLSEALTRHERWWPDAFDDSEIEALIWPEIAISTSRGDFACYLVHRLLKARHLEEARLRYDRMVDADPEPLHYFQAINKVRALCSWYSKGLDNGSHLRTAINAAESIPHLRDIIRGFFFAQAGVAAR